MTSSKRHKSVKIISRGSISLQDIDELLSPYPRTSETAIAQYDSLGEKRKKWIKRYTTYLKGKYDYCFFEHNLMIPKDIFRRINEKGRKWINANDEIFFHLKKHRNSTNLLSLCHSEYILKD